MRLRLPANFLANERDRARAIKRGGGTQLFSIDAEAAEADYAREPVEPLTPDRIFERRWALAVLDAVLARLASEYEARNRGPLFRVLKTYLQDDDSGVSYREMARRLDLSEGAVKVSVHRLRRRFGELLLEEVGQTLADGADARDEIGELLSALGGSGQNFAPAT